MHLLHGFLRDDLHFHGCFQSITPERFANLLIPKL